VFGLSVSPGSLVFYVVTVATILSALILPVVGAAADRSSRQKTIMAGFAWAGSLCAGGMFLVAGTDWQRQRDAIKPPAWPRNERLGLRGVFCRTRTG